VILRIEESTWQRTEFNPSKEWLEVAKERKEGPYAAEGGQKKGVTFADLPLPQATRGKKTLRGHALCFFRTNQRHRRTYSQGIATSRAPGRSL